MEDILLKTEVMDNQERSGYKKTKLGWIPEDWNAERLSKVSNKISSGATPLRSNEKFFRDGQIPWVKTTDLNNGKIINTEESVTDFALKSTNLKILPNETVLVAMYGGFNQIGRTGILKIPATTNQAISTIQINEDILYPEYLLMWLNYGVGFWKRYAASSRKDPNITKNDVNNYLIAFGNLTEQKHIISTIDVWNKNILKLSNLIKLKTSLKKGLMQQLLTGKNRLPGFSGEWKEYKLETFFTERNDKGYTDLQLLSLGEAGVYPQSDSNKKDTSNKDKSKYKRICPGDIGYNTMRLWQGRNALSHLEGIISPAYTVVTPKENAHAEFFKYLLKLPELVHKFYRNSQGLVSDTLNCKFKDFKIVKVLLPSTTEEQRAIANILLSADREMDLLKKKKELLQDQKKGLMQQLLTGKKRIETN